MKNNGFTLIELLAVIVILAIISLIVTPVILNIIDSTKDNANANSVKLYMRALENKLAEEKVSKNFDPEFCEIKNKVLTCDGEEFSVENDLIPDDGIVFVKDGLVSAYSVEVDDRSYYDGSNPVECFAADKVGTFFFYGCEDTDLIMPRYVPEYEISLTIDRDACIEALSEQENPERYCDLFTTIDTVDDAIPLIAFYSSFASLNYTKTDRMVEVKKIPFNLFYKRGLTMAILPDSITEIEMAAFSYNDIKYLKLPKNLKSIPTVAFIHNKLTSVNIPDSVTTIGSIAFDENNLKSVKIGKGITKIESNAFGSSQKEGYGPNELTSVKINVPSSMKPTLYTNSPFGWASEYNDNNIIWADSQ